jgi:hypothetical protein
MSKGEFNLGSAGRLGLLFELPDMKVRFSALCGCRMRARDVLHGLSRLSLPSPLIFLLSDSALSPSFRAAVKVRNLAVLLFAMRVLGVLLRVLGHDLGFIDLSELGQPHVGCADFTIAS